MSKKKYLLSYYKVCYKIGDNISNLQKLKKFKNRKWLKRWQFPRYGVSSNSVFNYRRKFLYNVELKSKIRLKVYYGSLRDKHFINLYNKTKNNLMFISILESRLDIILVKLNFVKSLFGARQLIKHGFVNVNNNKIFYSNYSLVGGDLIDLSRNDITIRIFSNLLKSVYYFMLRNRKYEYKINNFLFKKIDNFNNNYSIIKYNNELCLNKELLYYSKLFNEKDIFSKKQIFNSSNKSKLLNDLLGISLSQNNKQVYLNLLYFYFFNYNFFLFNYNLFKKSRLGKISTKQKGSSKKNYKLNKKNYDKQNIKYNIHLYNLNNLEVNYNIMKGIFLYKNNYLNSSFYKNFKDDSFNWGIDFYKRKIY